jgi:drug/metabolite transporter (DMT)-like permease
MNLRQHFTGRRWALLALLLGAMGIAFAPIFVRLSEVDPVATGFYRMFLSLPIFWLWIGFGATKISTVSRQKSFADYALLLLAGLFFAGDLAFWHWSIRLTSVANATLLANFAPIFVTLGALTIFGEKFRPLFYVGLGLAIIGVIILLGDSAALGQQNLLGDGLGIVTALFYAAYILTVGKLRARFTTATVMLWSGLSASTILAAIAIASEQSLFAMTAQGWLVLIGLALFSHAGGQSLIAYALAHLPAAFSSVGLLLQPALAALLAWLLLSEPLGALQALGAMVILMGIIFARRGS